MNTRSPSRSSSPRSRGMWAQALVEKGMLDNLSNQFTVLMNDIVLEIQRRPIVWSIFGVTIVLLVLWRKR